MDRTRTRPFARAASGFRLLAAVGWLALASPLPLAAAQVVASLDRGVVTLGEPVTLTITFDGLQIPGRPNLPQIPNFQVDQGQISSGTTIHNGALQQWFGFALVPTAEGDLTIPGFQFSVGGQRYSTQPLALRVVRPSASVAGPNPNTPQAFVTVVVPRREIYFGEVFLVEERLHYIPTRLALLQPNWSFLDGTFRVTPLEGASETDLVTNNVTYRVRVHRVLATPLKTGAFNSGPISLLMAFGQVSFFGQFMAEQRNRLAADPVVLQVLPVPSVGAPPSFNGAVGTYTLTVTAGPTEVAVGDPVTVKAQISGRGQFETLALPAQADWREFKMYPPTSVTVTNDRVGLACTKTFEQVVIPQNHEIKALPPLVFSFFDPDAKSFRTLMGPAIPLTVRANAGTAGPLPTLAGLTNNAAPAEKQPEMATIKVHLGTLSPSAIPLFQRGWFLALQVLPPALWLSLLARRKWSESLSRNPRLLRQRQVARVVTEGLAQLRAHAAAGSADDFFATVFHLLQEQIGERLDLPASAITEAVIDERLRPLGTPNETLEQLHGLFRECNLARYARTRDQGRLAEMIPQVETALGALKKLPEAMVTR